VKGSFTIVKIHKKAIIATSICTLIFLFTSLFLGSKVFVSFSDGYLWGIQFSVYQNLSMGLFGSSAIAIFVSLISYMHEREKTIIQMREFLFKFYFISKSLTEHTSEIQRYLYQNGYTDIRECKRKMSTMVSTAEIIDKMITSYDTEHCSLINSKSRIELIHLNVVMICNEMRSVLIGAHTADSHLMQLELLKLEINQLKEKNAEYDIDFYNNKMRDKDRLIFLNIKKVEDMTYRSNVISFYTLYLMDYCKKFKISFDKIIKEHDEYLKNEEQESVGKEES